MLAAVATASFDMPSNEPAPLVGTLAQAGPNGCIMAWSDGEAEVEVMGIDDEVIGMGAELFGMAEVPLLQAARGRSRVAVRPAMMVDLRMMNLLLRGVSVIRCSEPSASWMGRWEKKS
ncbi:hypothetical protein GCM10009529_14110 [Micropruina glycogenica]